MNIGADTASAISLAVAALGPGPLREESVAQHVAPLFSRVLDEYRRNAYFANHSLGRPLDATAHEPPAQGRWLQWEAIWRRPEGR